MSAALSKLWLWFWHLLPANPILVRVVSGASRRVRHLWLRAGYLIVLLTVVLGVLWYHMAGRSASLSELAKGASQTFAWASTAQLILMCFLAPVFTASAITQEKDARTFNILLSTPLSNAQIVLGSLMSRLYFVIMLLIAGLPIFLMTMVYGGVTTQQIIESFALAASTAILTGALAIFVAMLGVGTRRTIFSFYLLIALYLLAVYLLGVWKMTWVEAAPPNLFGRKMSWLTPLHPFLALDVALNRVPAPDPGLLVDSGSLTRWALANPSAAYVTWTTITAVAMVLASMIFVRRGAKVGEPTFWGRIFSRIVPRRAGERTRPARHVWANPVAWREAKTRAATGGVIRWIVVLSGVAASVAVFIAYNQGLLLRSEVPEWLAGLTIIQFALALMIATNTAATSMTKEREAKTMDLLLSTPLTSKYILWGKLRGLVSFAAPLLVTPVATILVFGIYEAFRAASPVVVWPEASIEIGVLMVIYMAVACVVGLKVSLVSRTNVMAVMTSVGIIILVAGILSIIGFAVVDASGGEFGALLAACTPFTAVRYLANPQELLSNIPTATLAREARIAAAIGSVIAALGWGFFAYRLYTGLVRDFDMTVRKQTGT